MFLDGLFSRIALWVLNGHCSDFRLSVLNCFRWVCCGCQVVVCTVSWLRNGNGINFYLRVLMTELEAENYSARKQLDCLWSNLKTYSWDGVF